MTRNIGDEIIEGLEEARAHARGALDLETTTYKFAPTDIKALRGELDMTQEEFATFFGISVHTLRCWEQGRREPEGPARTLLRIIEREPEAALRALHGDPSNRPAAR